jgi:transposase
MPKPVRPRRDFQQLEQRRKRAAQLFEAGKLSLADIARELQVSRQSVSRWFADWKRGGAAALRGAGRAGRKSKLQPQQLKAIDQALRQGAQAHGFSSNLWTLPRVALVIERLTGVRYHPGHVWKILVSMKWSLQRPARQARERDPKKIDGWINGTWPAIKKKLDGKKPGSSSKTKAGSPNGPRSGALGLPKGKPRS